MSSVHNYRGEAISSSLNDSTIENDSHSQINFKGFGSNAKKRKAKKKAKQEGKKIQITIAKHAPCVTRLNGGFALELDHLNEAQKELISQRATDWALQGKNFNESILMAAVEFDAGLL